jgi:hypothetical protein
MIPCTTDFRIGLFVRLEVEQIVRGRGLCECPRFPRLNDLLLGVLNQVSNGLRIDACTFAEVLIDLPRVPTRHRAPVSKGAHVLPGPS